jgi:hypothetical protein
LRRLRPDRLKGKEKTAKALKSTLAARHQRHGTKKIAPIKSTIPASFHECLVVAQRCATVKAKDQMK